MNDNWYINYDYTKLAKDKWKCVASISGNGFYFDRTGFGFYESEAYRAAYKELFNYLIETGLSDYFPGVLEVVKQDVWAWRYFRGLFAIKELLNNDFSILES
jgi:hypothetical protein